MATAFRRFARTCFQIAAERNHRTAVKLSSRHGRPLVLAVRSVAGCTEQCCRENQVTRCWKCNTKHVHGHPEFFCRECEVIQPPEEDATYFEIMDSPERFTVDVPHLQKTYRNLQFRLHPDRFSKCTPEEQQLSERQSSIINKAYNTLLKPLTRGKYLLKLHGISVDENDSLSSPEFLVEIMELNEQVEDAKNINDLQEIETVIQAKISKCTQSLSTAFEKGNYVKAKDKVIELRYYVNIEDQIKDRKSSMDLAGEH